MSTCFVLTPLSEKPTLSFNNPQVGKVLYNMQQKHFSLFDGFYIKTRHLNADRICSTKKQIAPGSLV